MLSKVEPNIFTEEAFVIRTIPSKLIICENRELVTVSWKPSITIWAQLSDPLAVQLSKTELLTFSDIILTETAPPFMPVEQSRKVESDMPMV
jgi:hypothetical protein